MSNEGEKRRLQAVIVAAAAHAFLFASAEPRTRTCAHIRVYIAHVQPDKVSHLPSFAVASRQPVCNNRTKLIHPRSADEVFRSRLRRLTFGDDACRAIVHARIYNDDGVSVTAVLIIAFNSKCVNNLETFNILSWSIAASNILSWLIMLLQSE